MLEGHTDLVRSVVLLDDGRVLSWSNDTTLRLWDAQTGESLAVLEGHQDEVVGVLPLGQDRLLSWAEDNTLRIWHTGTGECHGYPRGAHALGGRCACFTRRSPSVLGQRCHTASVGRAACRER